jgi:integrase
MGATIDFVPDVESTAADQVDFVADVPEPSPYNFASPSNYPVLNNSDVTVSTVQPEGALASAGRAFATGAAPAVGTLAAGALGSRIGAGLLSETGPVGMVAGAIGGDILAGTIGNKLTTNLQKSVMGQKWYEENQAQLDADLKVHPIATQMGAMIPMLISSLGGGGPAVAKLGNRILETATKAGRLPTYAERWQAGVLPAMTGFARMSAGEAAGQGKNLADIVDAGIKGAAEGGALSFVPAAKTLLGMTLGKAPADAAVLTTASTLYDALIHGQPIDPQRMFEETGSSIPGFVMLNLASGLLHKAGAARASRIEKKRTDLYNQFIEAAQKASDEDVIQAGRDMFDQANEAIRTQTSKEKPEERAPIDGTIVRLAGLGNEMGTWDYRYDKNKDVYEVATPPEKAILPKPEEPVFYSNRSEPLTEDGLKRAAQGILFGRKVDLVGRQGRPIPEIDTFIDEVQRQHGREIKWRNVRSLLRQELRKHGVVTTEEGAQNASRQPAAAEVGVQPEGGGLGPETPLRQPGTPPEVPPPVAPVAETPPPAPPVAPVAPDLGKGVIPSGKEVQRQGPEVIPEPAGPPVPPAAPAPVAPAQPATFESAANSLAAKIRAAKLTNERGQTYMTIVPPSVWNGALEVLARVIEGGGKVADAVAAALQHIRDNFKQTWDERSARKALYELTGESAPEEPKRSRLENLVTSKAVIPWEASDAHESGSMGELFGKTLGDDVRQNVTRANQPKVVENLATNYRDNVRTALRVWERAGLGDLRTAKPQDVTVDALFAMQEEAKKTQSYEMWKKAKARLWSALETARKSGLIQQNPIRLAEDDPVRKWDTNPRHYQQTNVKPAWWDFGGEQAKPGEIPPALLARLEEWRRTGKAASIEGRDSNYRTIADAIELLAFLGARPGEAHALQWGDIDWANGVIHIPGVNRGMQKSGKGHFRDFPLDPSLSPGLADFLKRLYQDRLARVQAGERGYNKAWDPSVPTNKVLLPTWKDTHSLNPYINSLWRSLGMPEGYTMSANDMRSFRGDRWLEQGLSPADFTPYLGHDVKTWNDYYEKTDAAAKRRNRLNIIKAGGQPVPQPIAPPTPGLQPKSPKRIAPAEPQPVVTTLDAGKYPTQEIPLAQIKFSKDIRQFKRNANARGVVRGEELGGKYERLGNAPIVLIRRLNGDLEIVTGRHRLDLAERTGEKTIPAQIVNEGPDFTIAQAKVFDAISNIRDEKGSVRDYADFFKQSTNLGEREAGEAGLLSRSKGRAGWDLGKNSTDDLWTDYVNGLVKEAQAVAIARTSPNNPAAQNLGRRLAKAGRSAEDIAGLLQQQKNRAIQMVERGEQGQFWSSDDSLVKEWEVNWQKAKKLIASFSAEIDAVQGAAENPELAAKHGVDVKDPEGIIKRIAELESKIEQLRKNPELADQFAPPAPEPKKKEESPVEISKVVPPAKDQTLFGDQKLEQNDLFSIQDVAKEVDPIKSANAAERLYGDPAKAADILERQLAVNDQDATTRKAFTKEQRQRLKEVIALLRTRAGGRPSSLALVTTNGEQTPLGERWKTVTADSKADILALLDRGNVMMNEETRAILRHLVTSKSWDTLPGFRLALTNWIKMADSGPFQHRTGLGEMTFDEGWKSLMRLHTAAEGKVTAEEILHHIFNYMTNEDRQWAIDRRREEVILKLAEAYQDRNRADANGSRIMAAEADQRINLLRLLKEGPMESHEFVSHLTSDNERVLRDLYPLINGDEFWAHMMNERAVKEFLRPADRTMLERFKDILRDFYHMIRRAFKLTTRDEEIWQDMIRGRYEYGPLQPDYHSELAWADTERSWRQVYGEPIGPEYPREKIDEIQGRLRAVPEWNFTGPVTPETTARVATLLARLVDPAQAQAELARLEGVSLERMAGSIMLSDAWDYAVRMVRDTGDQVLLRFMVERDADIASRFGAVSGSVAGSILRGRRPGAESPLWYNARQIFKGIEDLKETKLFGDQRLGEIVRVIREELGDPKVKASDIPQIISERLTKLAMADELKYAEQLLDNYQKRATEWVDSGVTNRMKEIVQEALRKSLSGKTIADIPGGPEAFQRKLSDDLFAAAQDYVKRANAEIERKNIKIREANEAGAIAGGEDFKPTREIPKIEIDEAKVQAQMDELAYNIWSVRLEREWTQAQRARLKEATWEDTKVQGMLSRWAQDAVEFLQPDRKSLAQDAIKKYLKGEVSLEDMTAEMLRAGVSKKTADEMAFQVERRKQMLDSNRRRRLWEQEAKRNAGLAETTAKAILNQLELKRGAEWVKPDVINQVREIIREALKIKPSQQDIEKYGALEASKRIGPITDVSAGQPFVPDPFLQELMAKLEAAGVKDPVVRQELAQAVGNDRSAQFASANVRVMERAAKSGRIAELMDEIIAAPFLLQQTKAWRDDVATRWFLSNGVGRERVAEAVQLFEEGFNTALNKAADELAKRLTSRISGAESVDEFIKAFRVGLTDPNKPWTEAYARKAGWRLPTSEEWKKLAEWDMELSDQKGELTLIERKEITERMMGIYLHMRLPPSLVHSIASNFIATNLTGIRTFTINYLGPALWMALDRALMTVAAPHRIYETWRPVVTAFKSFMHEFKYSVTTDAYTFINNEFEPASNELRRMYESGRTDLNSGEPARRAKGVIKVLYGSQQFFMRMLNAFDQASAVSIREAQLVMYGGEAMRAAGLTTGDVGNLVEASHRLKETAYLDGLRRGYSSTRAMVHADALLVDLLQSEIKQAIQERGVKGREGTDAAREARKAAEYDAYAGVGRLAPGVLEAEEGGLMSHAFIHTVLRISSLMRRGTSQDRMLAVAVMGYLAIPLRTARFYAWNSPYGLLRLGIHEYQKRHGETRWFKQSLANEYQEKYRLKQALAATAVQAVLTATGFALWGQSANSNDTDRKNNVFVTGMGPSNRNLQDAWLKQGFRPNSLVMFHNGKAITVPLTRLGEPMSHLFWILSARDDYNWRKKEKESTGNPFTETWEKTSAYGLGNYINLMGQRGLIQNLTSWGQAFGSQGGSETALAQRIAGVTASATMPFLGLQRSMRDITMGKVDTSSMQAAMLASFPVLAFMQRPAVNRFGDKLGNQTWYGKIADTGVPIAFQVADNSENRKLYQTLLAQSAAPPVLRRATLEEKYGTLTDDQFAQFTLKSGALLKKSVLDDIDTIASDTPQDARKLVSKLTNSADKLAAQAIGLEPTKPAKVAGGGLNLGNDTGGGLAASGGLAATGGLASERGLAGAGGLVSGGGAGIRMPRGGIGGSIRAARRPGLVRGRLGLRGGRRLSLRGSTKIGRLRVGPRLVRGIRRPARRRLRLSLA